jgi:hypothetical protein
MACKTCNGGVAHAPFTPPTPRSADSRRMSVVTNGGRPPCERCLLARKIFIFAVALTGGWICVAYAIGLLAPCTC